jgi:hypothetical protein
VKIATFGLRAALGLSRSASPWAAILCLKPPSVCGPLQSAPGPKGEPGPPGRDGRLRKVTEWSGGVHYEGDLVVRDGGMYQCVKDTGCPPPHEDWVCIARAGRDGRTPRVCGTWSPDGQCRALDVCALGGCSFIATKDNPGICPGDGWQALTLPGKRGQQGPPGARGERPGPAGTVGAVNRQLGCR